MKKPATLEGEIKYDALIPLGLPNILYRDIGGVFPVAQIAEVGFHGWQSPGHKQIFYIAGIALQPLRGGATAPRLVFSERKLEGMEGIKTSSRQLTDLFYYRTVERTEDKK